MKSEVDTDLRELRAELIQLRKDFGKLTDTLEETARHGATEARERVQHTVDGLRHDATKAAQHLTQEIERNPVSGALAAFGIGVVLGLFLSPRR